MMNKTTGAGWALDWLNGSWRQIMMMVVARKQTGDEDECRSGFVGAHAEILSKRRRDDATGSLACRLWGPPFDANALGLVSIILKT